jgi:hypothetical protein
MMGVSQPVMGGLQQALTRPQLIMGGAAHQLLGGHQQLCPPLIGGQHSILGMEGQQPGMVAQQMGMRGQQLGVRGHQLGMGVQSMGVQQHHVQDGQMQGGGGRQPTMGMQHQVLSGQCWVS